MSPGSRMTGKVAPPRPAASMMMTAPMTGDPKSEEMAAKLAAAAIRARTWSGVSFLDSLTARIPRPAPMAIRGASGPSTIPSPMEANAARRTLGSSIGCVGGPPFRPSAGWWPPDPGRRAMAK